MKFYIASSLGNAESVRKISNYLGSRGWEQTYDWTTHGLITNPSMLPSVAIYEINGVINSDVVFVLLPGARGTHAELGAAIASKKPIIILATSPDAFNRDGHTCVFYHHPLVRDHIVEYGIPELAFQAHRIGRKVFRKETV